MDGKNIRKNTKLRELSLHNTSMGEGIFEREDMENFLRGISCNKSIRKLSFHRAVLYGGDIFNMLVPFFKTNQNFESLEISEGCFEPGDHSMLISALSEFSSLKELMLDGFGVQFEVEQAIVEIITALSGHLDFRSLHFRGIDIGQKGCTALANFLQNPKSKLIALDLSSSFLISDEDADILASGLTGNSTLKDINLGGDSQLTRKGWQTIFAAMQTSGCLENISLRRATYSSNDCLGVSLVKCLSKSTQLKSLNLSNE